MQQKNECAFVCVCERAVGLCGMWCFIKQGYQTTQSETWTYTSWSVAVVKVFTHTIHIKAKGNESSPCLEILSSSYFFSRLLSLETGTTFPTPPFSPRFTPNSPWCQLVFSHIFHHILHTYFILYLSVLTFHSLFHVSYLPVHLTCTSKPVSLRPSEWNPGGFLLNAVPFIVRLTICLSYFLCSDVSGKNKPLSYLHSPKRDRFIARQ